ncbi:glycosyltransferase [Shewanella algidipiscicola]|uniref:glycosyltransferase n=1 Tax=Shewanella algidipiscicola TaxID=614070 RepID=UPI000D78822E|nr:glycosyltransferase [Shewanella algidipiscicola]
MKDNDRKVSVYIPTHNRSCLLFRAVYSVLNQDYKNIEVVISDDGSSDDTPDICNALMLRDDRVRYIRTETARGANHARNLAIQNCTGHFVTGLDDDDFFLPTRISTFINNYNGQYSFYYSQRKVVSKIHARDSENQKGRLDLDRLLHKNYVGNQVFVERSRIVEAGLFDEDLLAWQDYDCWIRIMQKFGDAYGLDSVDYIMDISHESERISTSKKAQMGIEQFMFKYRDILSKKHLKTIESELLIISGNKIKVFDLFRLFNTHNIKRMLVKLVRQ